MHWLLFYFKKWHFDPISSIVTVVLIPFFLYLLKIVLAHLKRLGSYALEGIFYAINRFLWHSLAASLSLRRYCRLQLNTESKHLFVPSSRDIKLDLDEVFVTLTMDYQGSARTDYSHRDMLKIANRLRVIGDPGSGKSSLSKKLFRDACKKALDSPREARLPILLELKRIQPPKHLKPHTASKWLYEYVMQIVKATSVYRMEECFEAYANTQGLLVILDGLDEVALGDYARVHALIDGLNKALTNKSDNNVIVLTMRTQFHQQVKDNYRDSFGPALFIKPFSPTDIYEFITRWPFQGDHATNVSRIYKQLTDRPTLREMCTNPLILSMYVAEDQNSNDVIAPESRTEFYSKVTEELILKRRSKQIGFQSAAVKLKEQRENILGKICFEHLLDSGEPANSLSWKRGVALTQSTLGCAYDQAEERFRELSKETGLFAEERTQESFRFIHLTLCEFLAAYETVQGQRDGWKQLIAKHRAFLADCEHQTRSRLLEVIPFACGLLPRVQRDQALGDVASLNDFPLLARCFFETKLYEHSSWEPFVARAQKEILHTPESSWDERWLSDLHLLNLVVRDAQLSSAHVHIPGTTDLADFYRTLLARQKASLNKLLSAYAMQDAAAAFRIAEVCRLDLATAFPQVIIKHADQTPFFALVLEQAGREPNRFSLWATLLSEAGLRSRVVAEQLNTLKSIPQLDLQVGRLPTTEHWFLKGCVEKSCYTQMVTLAGRDGALEGSTPFLHVLKTICGPGCYKFRDRFERWSSIGFVAAFFIATLGTAAYMAYMKFRFPDIQRLPPAELVVFLCVFPLYALGIYFRIASVLRKNAFKQLLNLRAAAAFPSSPYGELARAMGLRKAAVALVTAVDPFYNVARFKKLPKDIRQALDSMTSLRQQPSLATTDEGATSASFSPG